MKLTLAFLLSTLAANAASVSFEWQPSLTPGCSNVFYLSQSALTNLATTTWKFPLGTNTTARATLSPGTWYLAVTAVNSDVESDPARLTIIVPAGVTALREAPATAKARAMGHDRQRRITR